MFVGPEDPMPVGVGAGLAPHIPWLAFSFAMLARFGPALLGVLVFLIPAVELAVDQRLLNASPPGGLAPPAGLLVLVVLL